MLYLSIKMIVNGISTCGMRPGVRVFFFACLTLCVFCCDRGQQAHESTYAYEPGMTKYLLDVHDMEVKFEGDRLLFFLNINSCEPCVNDNLRMLSDLKTKNLTVVLIGINGELLNQYKLSKSLTVLNDPDSQIMKYRTGMGKPMLLHVKNGEYVFFSSYNATQPALTKTHLLERAITQ